MTVSQWTDLPLVLTSEQAAQVLQLTRRTITNMLDRLSNPAKIQAYYLAEEIKEILLHATVYCGIPAGLEAFKAAHEVLKAEGALPGK